MFFKHRHPHFLTRRITHTVNLKRERQVAVFSRGAIALVFFAALVSVVGYSLWGHADTTTTYPASCLGSWLNVSNAAGKPDLTSGDSSLSFNGQNSAVLLGGAGVGDKQIFCSGFTEPDQRASSTLVSAQLALSWTIAGKDQVNPEIPVSAQTVSPDTASSSGDIQTTTSSEAQTATSSSSTTSDQAPSIDASSSPTVPSDAVPGNAVDSSTPAATATPPAPAALNGAGSSSLSARGGKQISFFSAVKNAILSYLFLTDARAQTEASTTETPPPPAVAPPPDATAPAPDATTASPAPAADTSSPSTPPIDGSAPSLAPTTQPDTSAPIVDTTSSSPTTDSSTPAQIENNTVPDTSSDSSATASTTGQTASSTLLDDTTASSSSPTSSTSSASSSGDAPAAVSAPRPALFEVRYSFDGSVWEVAGRVTPPDFNESFPIPLSSHADLSHLQIAVVPVDASLLPDGQAVYLDGMMLTITYQAKTQKISGHPDRISFSSDQTTFSPDEVSDSAFDGSGAGAPCVSDPFSQTIPVGGQAIYTITVPNNGFEFVTKLGNYPPNMTPVFVPVSANAPIVGSVDVQAATMSTTTDTIVTTSTDSTTAATDTAQVTATGTADANNAGNQKISIPGQTTLVIDTTASTTPGSYTLVVLYGSKDADKNVSTGLCQVNLIVR